MKNGKAMTMTLTASYDRDTWELTVTVDGTTYVYTDVSPHHSDQFRKRARRNKGRAMAYIRTFQRKE